MKLFVWHLHGSYTTSLVQGEHEYLIPVLPDRGPFGRGRAETWEWPASAVELTPFEAAGCDVDVVILQRPEELELGTAWLGGRVPGRDLPAIYLEHNAPQGRIADMEHPMAHLAGSHPLLQVVHVTHFNALFWDCGALATRVVEHGVVDPGYRYGGELERCVATINEPARRGRVTGTDLLEPLARDLPIDLFGIGVERAGGIANLSQHQLYDEMARRRAYVHPFRWTSLGLSLLEAMHLGMPIAAVDTTEASEAVPPTAGVVSNRIDVLQAALRRWRDDPDEAREVGQHAREAVLARYGLERFLADWDDVLARAVALERVA
ncbi:MAG: glycosyl transferase, group 1 [Thermoleophilia bacterium]|nr:glycosyl transferase, group 1 [Thermoleophilia bacterium]MCZ4495976.1 glycosyl transferase, group 1 [Thermoleophilia bacterium]